MTQARQEKLETSIDCVLFDLDGTLIDTAPDFTLVVNKLLEEHDKMPLSQEVIHLNVSNGARALVKNAFNIDETHDDFSDLLKTPARPLLRAAKLYCRCSLPRIRRLANAIGSTKYSLGDRNQ